MRPVSRPLPGCMVTSGTFCRRAPLHTTGLTLILQRKTAVCPVRSSAGSLPRTPRKAERLIVGPLDALDTMGLGVSTMQVIENAAGISFRGRFGRFGRFQPHTYVGAHMQARAGIRARAGRRPKCPKCPSIRIYVYFSKACAVDGCELAVSKVSTAIEYARILTVAGSGSARGCKRGVCCAWRAVSGGQGGQIGARDGQFGRSIRAVVEQSAASEGIKATQKQVLSDGPALVATTRSAGKSASGAVFSDIPPGFAGGGTPGNAPPRLLGARFAVIVPAHRASGLAEGAEKSGAGVEGTGVRKAARAGARGRLVAGIGGAA